MPKLNKERAQQIRKDLKEKFGIHFDSTLNFANYRAARVTFKIRGELTDDKTDLRLYKGCPFHPDEAGAPAQEVVKYIQDNYPDFDTFAIYGSSIGRFPCPHAIIICIQK